ncbi:anaerobic ribonucleoside triphosphate reductase [Leptotrichia sp. oral taxon 847]|uniref:anaerobic ribonucleoside triphosphate reductase n=1 Tax=Leptotrichia sp. oral taxon 847 TaxID=1785996 RepID=UPI0007681231|nr:anaerobic ribonucleoside triphosphate reductase [Leptotrichia sp. oral taxon 847]AMD94809.1 anaerobic ribonucleoside triphosphate reductase [Leptotrichia sp. oral taxon 847]
MGLELTPNLNKTIEKIINVEKNDTNNENANMSSMTPAGQMMKFASEVSKVYALENLISEKFRKAHEDGIIHIHDLDFYPSKTTTCLQYDLEDMFEKGFVTKHGYIREAQSILTYATLATIIFQTNQNEQHGGQAIPAFDFYMAKGVLKSFRQYLKNRILNFVEIKNDVEITEKYEKDAKAFLKKTVDSIKTTEKENEEISKYFSISINDLKKLLKSSYKDTKKETYQAMEGFLHNLNTMHSRGGNQVVFSSINYGTDTSYEGRMVIKELLRATSKGLGKGETPIFPIQIFKVKEGLNFSENDYNLARSNFENLLESVKSDENIYDESKKSVKFETPNFDLLLLACETTSRRLFPNFVFLDAEFNRHEKWDMNDPKKYRYEIATMGCRTRVFENVNGEKTSLGRGNLSFTSINFPRLAIETRKDVEEKILAMEKENKFSSEKEKIDKKNEMLVKEFQEKVLDASRLAGEQLLERFKFQKTALSKQFPFMKGNNLWKGLGDKKENDEVGDAINSGTLAIGFVGGANAMYALFDVEHGTSELAYKTLYDTVEKMEKVANEFKDKYHLNYSVLASPAESLAGRFLRMDREKFGVIKNVTDRDYYVNSFHIDVKKEISIFDKIRKEAPFHKLTKGGHITYVELDGEARKNISVILKIVKVMKDSGIGYGSINHPVDRCKDCGTEAIIYDSCPVCGSHNISRIRRITGYLTGDLESWNSAKKAEEMDRVKHGI